MTRKRNLVAAAVVLAVATGACNATSGARSLPTTATAAGSSATVPTPSSSGQPSIGQTARGQPAEATFTVLTFNLFVGNRDLGAVVDLLRRADATIVCLQETIPVSQALLRRELSDMYPTMKFAVGRVGNGPGLLAKLPLDSGRYLPSVKGYNGFFLAKLHVAGRALQVVNAHLHPTIPSRRSLSGLLESWMDGEAVRLSEIGQIAAAIDSALPTVLAGDLNTFSSSQSFRQILERGFVDGAAETAEPTFRGLPLGVRIDFVLQRGPLRLVSSRVITPSSSDHDPVLATFAWR